LRTLCELARAFHAARPIALKVADLAERLLVDALATVNPEMLILEVLAGVAAHSDSRTWRDDPLWWLDPRYDPAAPTRAESARAGRPKPRVL
jgi:hypothetical protein